MIEWYLNSLKHHGILGQKWGVRRSPEELGKHVRFKLPKMPIEEYTRACDLWNKTPEIKMKNKNEILSAFSGISDDEKERCLVYTDYGNFHYTAINKGHEEYKVIRRRRIPDTNYDDWMDEIMSQVIGDDWRDYDD